MPIELTAFKRGTINSPGSIIPRFEDDKIYEVVTLENADYDETEWEPSRMSDGVLDGKQDGETELINTDRDDDFVKLNLLCPVYKVAGSSSVNFDQDGQGERMKSNDIHFYNSKGERILLSSLVIDNLMNPSGPLSPAFTGGGLDLFFEIGDLGKTTTSQGSAESITKKYADLIWKLSINGCVFDKKLRIYRGGFWRCDRNNNNGTISLYDGKGKNSDGSVDFGQLIKGKYQIKTGQEGCTDETIAGLGPTPMGWYGLWTRNAGGNTMDMRISWLNLGGKWNRPQTNHHVNETSNPLGYVQQGSYCQMAQTGNYIINGKGPYGYDNGNDANPYEGIPASIHFKFELCPIGNFTTRDLLQIHPDGFCDGTAGCIGVQTYSDCCKLLFLVNNYYQTRILVD